MSAIEFTVNGTKCSVDAKVARETSLNVFIRGHLALPGTKAMCRQGGCGACVVAVRATRVPLERKDTFSVNSCLVLVFSCHGWDITTVEGVGNRRDGYSDIQKRLAAFNGTQCGYCTPGWVMQMYSLQDKHLTMEELEKSFGSNTCRCTGYRPILDTMKSFAVDASPSLCHRLKDIEELPTCTNKSPGCTRKCSLNSDGSDWSVVSSLVTSFGLEGQNPINLDFGKNKFFKVYDESQIFEVLNRERYDSYMLVDGNTAKGVMENFEYPRILIDISGVTSLKQYEFDQNLILGANMSIYDTKVLFEDASKNESGFEYLSEFAKHYELIAHLPIVKIASLAGNLMIKHKMPTYQSDVYLLFAAVGAIITIRDSKGSQIKLEMADFLKEDMVGMLILYVAIPPLSSSHVFRSYKIMPRNQNALAIVNGAFLTKFNDKSKLLEECSIVYGNISSTFEHSTQTEAFLKGKLLYCNETLQGAVKVLSKEITPENLPPQPSVECRKMLAISLFYKFVLNTCEPGKLAAQFRSGANLISRRVSKGSQDYQSDPSLYPLNQPAQKLEAVIQSTGEAQYANDIAPLPREVFGAFVLATVHRGQIDKIDAEEVLNTPGVHAIYTAKDIPGKNSFIKIGNYLMTEDEEILASDDIKYYGQPVAIIVAKTEYLATEVAKKVKVAYKNISTSEPYLTIDQVKKDSKRLIPSDQEIKPSGKGESVKSVVKGVYEVQGQYHYYMEPISCVVVPVDSGLEVYDATQWMDLSQVAVAQALNMNVSDVHLKVRRIGGGFGGKISRNVQTTTACALVAKKLNVPCRFILPIDTNMAIAGKRMPCQIEYEVGVEDNGAIQYLNGSLIEDKGCSNNENILEYVIGGLPNCYDTKYWTCKTGVVLTDLASNTFARAPGTLEGMACIEEIMEHIAFAVQKDATEVRLANMRKEDNALPQMIEEFKKDTDYHKRHEAIQQFNAVNRWMKKAIQISVMSFPVEYYGNYSAMVSIYRGDGTVTVTTGGIEMGQGVNTKAAQVCAYCLGIPMELVSVLPNYTFVAANNVFSGSSITSESVCYSIIKSCEILKNRLAPVKEKMDNPTWKDLITKAYEEEIDLVCEYMMTDKEEDLKSYTASAVTVAEVQLDVLLGRFEILRVDILEDVGLSANPAIDIGQVEGGYVQGLGYFTSEKLVYDKNTGKLLTSDSLRYHVPLARDIPADFRIKLRYNSKNTKGVLGSKAVGEMGVCTSQGITHALRQCIHESRLQSGHKADSWINIDVPYDTESIIKALDVKIEELLIT